MMKTREERREILLDRKKKLEEQLKRFDARTFSQKRKDDTRRKIIAGAITLHHAETNPEYREWLAKELKSSLTRQHDINLFAEMISENDKKYRQVNQ